jgi:hypothetical protein
MSKMLQMVLQRLRSMLNTLHVDGYVTASNHVENGNLTRYWVL